MCTGEQVAGGADGPLEQGTALRRIVVARARAAAFSFPDDLIAKSRSGPGGLRIARRRERDWSSVPELSVVLWVADSTLGERALTCYFIEQAFKEIGRFGQTFFVCMPGRCCTMLYSVRCRGSERGTTERHICILSDGHGRVSIIQTHEV